MRFLVTHSTVYRYSGRVSLNPHVFRLRPRDDGSQRLVHYRCAIDPPPAGQSECLDQDGNVVLQTWFDSPAEELRACSEFEVETVRENPFDFVLMGDLGTSLPFQYSGLLAPAMYPYLRAGNIPDPVRSYAAEVARSGGSDAMGYLLELSARIHGDIRHIIRPEGPPFSSERTLQLGEGSCRDVALLFADSARAMGFAARFVSGYELAAANEEHAYMHAWAEVYLPGGGWRGYDPSRGLAVSTSHVAVAAAADPLLATPVQGTYSGMADSRIEAKISMITLDSETSDRP